MDKLALPEYLLNEKLERAARGYQVSSPASIIHKLFLVIPVPQGREGEIDLETKYGKLKTFFCHQLQEFQKYGAEKPKALLLSTHKFSYPKISKVKPLRENHLDGYEQELI